MSDEAASHGVIARLDHLLAAESLTGLVARQARDLRDRLSTGVRVVLMGPKGAGKSQLCTVLLGEDVPPGPSGSAAICLRSGADPEGPAASSEGDVCTLTLANPLLQLTTVTDVTAPADPQAFADRVRWALARADIVLWCTGSFAPEEAALWARACDHTKDHSLLVLTQADVLAADGTLQDQITRLQAVAAEEFHSFFPVSTFHAHKALHRSDEIPDAQLAASGVKAVRQTVLHLAASGQRADLDSALLFLQRNEPHQTTAPAPARRASDRTATPAAQTYGKALALLRSRMADMSPVHEAATLDVDLVLSTCGTLTEDLAELAADQTYSDPAFDAWRNDLYEASDKVVLMTLEHDLRSAADATTVILQLKRDLEERVAD